MPMAMLIGLKARLFLHPFLICARSNSDQVDRLVGVTTMIFASKTHYSPHLIHG